MHKPNTRGIVIAAGLCSLLLATAAPDRIIEHCSGVGCSTVVQLLAPCGGGATNASLQQDLIYTPTASLGECECNSQFYDAFSSCLTCIGTQGKNSPEIQNRQDWITNCAAYGFNFTSTPVTNSTNNNNNNNHNDSGLSKGAIVGIVVGAIILLALIGACFFLRKRRTKQDKAALFEQSPTSGAGVVTTADPNYHDQEYPSTYDHQNNYYPNQQSYEDPSTQQQYGNHNGQYQYASGYQNHYYDMDGHNDNVMMQELDHSHNSIGAYVPPPPHPASSPTVSTVGAGAAAHSATVRPSDSFPQSLRSKPKNWGTQEPSSSLAVTDSTQYNDKAEFDECEALDPPRSRDRFVNDRDDFTPRRSMTPPRANMQSYREEMNRASIEREPRLSGSERGSFSLARGMDSNSNLHGDHDRHSDDHGRLSQDSPESARRRARAAELFSAEGRR
ncbi:hypothetical protein BX616_005838 [Lobosporangium transversale]|uniref:Uncharacterized protein n=1 Tax=Lobosporangium transversale TaxID=64571 RepID=A0A1Y2GLL7_9FUNG|nr:hypothetical protein BCR41DRAFT_356280 [Lobosporangium transversale]KAF9915580.1 hypothetical protein BX616_005838 [Lobosporangium transversale]ORZ12555.1 hypothetical protein BCR41DRAFT_356280 [Lobosporangium transversale]|eukprot:XP_021880174.1 hypothetical protein BCR41DRAFT_356280 [Lobosporangium transversale]